MKQAFIMAFNRLSCDKERYIAAIEEALPLITDVSNMETEATRLAEERDVVTELIRKCVEENARTAQDQAIYRKKYDGLVIRYEAVQQRLVVIATEHQERAARRERTSRFFDILRKAQGLLTEFDEGLWCATVERVDVHTASKMTVTFRDGGKVKVDISE